MRDQFLLSIATLILACSTVQPAVSPGQSLVSQT